MAHNLTRRTMIAAGVAAYATQVFASTRQYALVKDRSRVGFRFTLSGAAQMGTVPVKSADIRVNPANLVQSTADVEADITGAKTGLVFITQALLSSEVLDAKNHPIVRFRSTKVQLGARGRISEGAKITGDLTLRGVTRAITLDAVLSRPAGTDPADLSTLNVDLSGGLDRRDYGAVGYPALVAPRVDLAIRAEIREVA
ncbi:MAG: YceI family protein [Roseobacter sp.]